MFGKIKAVYQLLRAFFEAFENGKNKVFHGKFQKCFFFFKKSKKFKEFTEGEEKYTKINKVVANFSRTLLVA